MRVKASSRVEGIFAHAVAMDNRGMRNIIHCIGSNVFIVNFDYSMILRFSLRQSEISFDSPVSFNANEYDSPDFSFTEDESGGKIVFHTNSGEYARKKICRGGESGPSAKDISKIYRQLRKEGEAGEHLFYLADGCVPLLEEGLSHTEISVEDSVLILRQRNVYTGTMIEVVSSDRGGFFTVNKLPETLPTIALKTKDFMSLFSIHKSLAFTPAEDFVLVKDPQKGEFDGVLSLCRYDMIIDLHRKGGEKLGREKQETGASEQAVDRPDQARVSRRKKTC